MTESRRWQRDASIPRVTQVQSVERYNEADIKQELMRLRGQMGQSADLQLTEAANSWAAAQGKLDTLAQGVKNISERLAEVWSSDVSADSQRALMLMYDTAESLADTSHRTADFTGTAAGLMQNLLVNGPKEDDPGAAESAMGGFGEFVGGVSPAQLIPGIDGSTTADIGRNVYGTVGGWVDGLTGRDRTEEYQAALNALNQSYVAETWRMPYEVSAELPQIEPIAPEEVGGPGMPPGSGPIGSPSVPGAPMPPGASIDPPGAGMGPGASIGGPSPGAPGAGIGAGDLGGPGAGIPGTGIDGDHGGGLAGAGGLGGPGAGIGTPGAGIGAPGGGGIPAGAGGMGAGGVGPGGVGVGGIGPGAGRPGMGGGVVPMGGGGAGGRGAGAAGRGIAGAGRGIGGAGVGAGRPGMAGGMVPMGGGGAGAGGRGAGATGRGVAGAGAGRPGMAGGMVPAGGAGAGGRGSGTGAGAGRGIAGAGRPGMAGGAVPMGGRGSGSDQDKSHDSWLVEDDDPWRADDDVPPGVIK